MHQILIDVLCAVINGLSNDQKQKLSYCKNRMRAIILVVMDESIPCTRLRGFTVAEVDMRLFRNSLKLQDYCKVYSLDSHGTTYYIPERVILERELRLTVILKSTPN